MTEEILTYENKISKSQFFEMVDCHCIFIIFRTHRERSLIPLFILYLPNKIHSPVSLLFPVS